MDGYTRAVSEQVLGKHVSTRNNGGTVGNGVFSTWSVLRYYEQETRLELSQFCTGAVKKGLETEAEE
jgi:hypothetical protein